jgi:aspartate/tyrosine/aromatic aminotransferase
MFQTLVRVPDDPLLGITAAFRRDAAPEKVDLGVGVYKDDQGTTPVPAAVRRAEQQLIAAQNTKTYVAPTGNAGFNAQMLDMVLGAGHAGRAGSAIAVQAPGGCGALRLGAELVKLASPATRIYLSDPTWANHAPLLGGAGLPIERYPYYSAADHSVLFPAMLESLDKAPAGSAIVLHACCHNPTGQDLDPAQWKAVTEVVARRGLLPFVDLAYQGLAESLEADVAAVRLMAQAVPEMLIAVSCSKNFGLYRERTGAIIAITASSEGAGIATGQLARIGRTIWSMPPDHGAAIVDRVLSQPELRREWSEELAAMTLRINSLRSTLAAALARLMPGSDFGWITRQRGMFSRLPLTQAMVTALRETHHVYVAPDGRANIAGVSTANVERVASAIAAVMSGR